MTENMHYTGEQLLHERQFELVTSIRTAIQAGRPAQAGVLAGIFAQLGGPCCLITLEIAQHCARLVLLWMGDADLDGQAALAGIYSSLQVDGLG